jgi:ribonucleoside-diphosphate reductase alpha chain
MDEEKEVKISKIRKRDGRIVDFDKNKITEAIWKAAKSVGGKDRQLSEKLANQVVELLEKQLKPGEIPTVEQVQDLVEKVLVENGHYKTAKAYILYRKERTLIREEKKRILQKEVIDEIDKKFSLNAIQILASRYLQKNEEGKLIESPKQLFQRVAALIVIPDILHDEKIFDKEGKQEIKEVENFKAEEYEGKLGLGDVKWNRWHLERMKNLYDELN